MVTVCACVYVCAVLVLSAADFNVSTRISLRGRKKIDLAKPHMSAPSTNRWHGRIWAERIANCLCALVVGRLLCPHPHTPAPYTMLNAAVFDTHTHSATCPCKDWERENIVVTWCALAYKMCCCLCERGWGWENNLIAHATVYRWVCAQLIHYWLNAAVFDAHTLTWCVQAYRMWMKVRKEFDSTCNRLQLSVYWQFQ